MAAGCLPIVLKAGGPGDAVTPEAGIALELSNPNRTAEEIYQALREAWKNPSRAGELASAARERVRSTYLASRIPRILHEAYSLAAKSR